MTENNTVNLEKTWIQKILGPFINDLIGNDIYKCGHFVEIMKRHSLKHDDRRSFLISLKNSLNIELPKRFIQKVNDGSLDVVLTYIAKNYPVEMINQFENFINENHNGIHNVEQLIEEMRNETLKF